MSNTTTENASSVHPLDLDKALSLVEGAASDIALALDRAIKAHSKEYDGNTERHLKAAGMYRNDALERIEEASRILARLAALRD